MANADEKKKEKGEDGAVACAENLSECITEFLMKKITEHEMITQLQQQRATIAFDELENLRKSCSTQVFINKFKAATDIDEKIYLVRDHQARTKLLQLFADSDLPVFDSEAKDNSRRLPILDDLLDFEAQQCKLEVALAALQVMKKGERPFYQPQSFGECPFCLDEMFEKVTNKRCKSIPVAIQYPCCENACCWSCRHDLILRLEKEKSVAVTEYLLLGGGKEAFDLVKEHAKQAKKTLQCPFCRAPMSLTDEEETEMHRQCAERGDRGAQCEYGYRLLYGTGVDASPVQGKHWLMQAANKGCAKAKIVLAEESIGASTFGNDAGAGKDLPSQAKIYIKELASAGHPYGQFLLALEDLNITNRNMSISNENYNLLLLAAWQLHEGAEKFLEICIAFDVTSLDNIDEAHMDAKLLFWSERQTKYGSPSAGYHKYLQYYGERMLPRALYWGRREVLEATRSRNNPGIFQHHSAAEIESMKINIREMEELIASMCANCHRKRSRTLHLNFCNRCKAAKYCSKTCQVEHWKAGHKKECIDITKDQTSKIPNRAPEYDELIDMIKKGAWESSRK